MPVVKTPDQLEVRTAPGYTETVCAGPDTFGLPVPMRARRFVVEPGARAPVDAGGEEVMVYVIGGSGALETGTERHDLSRESMAWVQPPGSFTLDAGPSGLEVLVSEAPAT